MIIDAVFKEEEALKADFGVLSVVKGGKGECDYSLVAPALKCSASGNPILLDDVSPLYHEMAVGVKSKNIWRFEDMKHRNVGDVLTKTDTGFISKGNVGGAIYTKYRWLPISALDGTELTLSTNITPSGKNEPAILIRCVSEDDATKYELLWKTKISGNFSYTFKVDSTKAPTCKYIEILFYSNYGSEVNTTSTDTVEWYNFQIEEGTTATAYTPYVDVSGAEVQKLGKNLWQFEDMVYLANWSVQKTETGFKAAAASTQQYVQGSYRWLPISALDGKTLVISCTMTPSGNNKPLVVIGYCDENGTTPSGTPSLEMKSSGSVAFAVDSTKANGCKYIKFIIYKNGGSTESTKEDYVEYSNFQVELDTATEYEPYHCETFTADENGKVNGIIGNGEDFTLMADGAVITAEYNRDINKAFEEINQKLTALSAVLIDNV